MSVRDDLIKQILTARTPDEIRAAYQAALRYLRVRDDYGVRAALESLVMLAIAEGVDLTPEHG